MNYVAAARAAWQAWSGELDRQRAGRNREAQRRARIRAHSERELQRFARFGQEWPSLNCAAAVWQMLDHIIRRIRWWLSWPERRKTRRWLLEFNAQLARQLGDRDLCRYASGSCVSSIFQAACIAEALRRGLDVPAKELR